MPSCLRLLEQVMRAAAARTFWMAGSSRPISTAMMAITTSSSISVNARPREKRRRTAMRDPVRNDGTNTTPRRRGIPRPLFSRPTFALAHAFALAQVEAAVRRGGSERLADPVGPEYFDRIDLIDRAQSEMSDRLAAASVALSRVQPRGPEAAPAPDPDLGPVGDALRGGVRRPPRPPHAR